MAVIVGSARHDENGGISGGKAGDQTGEEVSKQEWYLHKKGWVCVRAKSAEVREKIAQDMEWACANPYIGYDQNQNQTLFNVAKSVDWNCSKVTTNCETDCARLVRVCVWYAGVHCPDFYTGDLAEVLKSTGQFEVLTAVKYTTTSNNLLRGDILVTKTKGHTVVVLSNGKNILSDPVLRYNDSGEDVKRLQEKLVALKVLALNGKTIKVTGTYGSQTESTVKNYQTINGLKVDGICGEQTWGALNEDKLPKIKVTTAVNCRSGPGTNNKIVKVLYTGYIDYYVLEKTGWILLKNANGWINKKYTS